MAVAAVYSAQPRSFSSMAWHDLEDASQAQAFLGELIDEWGEDSPRIVARTLAWLGQRDQAFEWLERVNKIEMLEVAFNPLFADLHDDPRWLALLERVEMDPQRLAELEFNPQFSGE